METTDQPNLGKSRLPEQEVGLSSDQQMRNLPPKLDKKSTPVKFGLIFSGIFIFLIIVSVTFRVYTQDPVDPSLDKGEEISLEESKEEVSDIQVDISAEELFYEEPERIYHIEKRQQFCADDINQARKLYSEYIGTKNNQVLEVKPVSVSLEKWISDKKEQGAYRENLGEREREYYYEYPTTAGPYVDLMRIHKCEFFDPGGRIVPIISISEDGYIPEYELGFIDSENLSEDEITLYIQYLISLRHEEKDVQSIRMKSSGDFLTLTVDMTYDGAADWINLKKLEEVYVEAVYKLNIETGLLRYSAQLIVREIIDEEVSAL